MENTNYNKDQVFISFRGKDERYKFLTHLKQKLIENNVNVFTDDNVTGKKLTNLFKEIQKSRIAIVLFSKNYAESPWCLDEMVEIKKCIETKKLEAVIPIFYKVKANSVKKQSGKFGRQFKALQDSLLGEALDKKKRKHVNSRIKRWKKAFEVVTGMAGLSYNKNSSEFDFLMKVVEKVKLIEAKMRKVHSSRKLEALSLAGPNREGYIMSIYLKPWSPNIYKYIEKPSGHKMPQTGPLPSHRRTFSNPILVPKEGVDLGSCDNIGPKEYNNEGVSCVSYMRYVFDLCLCLTSGAKDDRRLCGNELSIASN